MIQARHDTRRRVLLVGEAVTLAHVARPIALARKLVARGYRPILAADPRFAATYDRIQPGLAVFLRDAIRVRAGRPAE